MDGFDRPPFALGPSPAALHHDPPDAGDEADCKRPRLRLARACDRCKRRKIKCDTNSPCQPCILAKQPCTFNTPTRRASKPRIPTLGSGSFSADPSSSSTASSPYAPLPPGGAFAAARPPRKNVKDLEARMASLEEQLRRSTEVPPHVHNQALSQLDASLLNPSMSSGSTPPSAAGNGGPQPSAPPPQGATGHGTVAPHGPSSLSHQAYPLASSSSAAGSSSGTTTTLLPPAAAALALPAFPAKSALSAFHAAQPSHAQQRSASAPAGVAAAPGESGLEKQMEGMDLSPGFIYLDEMGMTKWQGATSGFPLLELLASAERHPPTSPSGSTSTPASTGAAPAGTRGGPAKGAGGESSTSPGDGPRGSAAAAWDGAGVGEAAERGRSRSRDVVGGGGGGGGGNGPSPSSYFATSGPSCSTLPPHTSPLASPPNASTSPSTASAHATPASSSAHTHPSAATSTDDDFFPGRKSREVKSLNPEASWKVITGVIEPDLMDTLIRSYLSTTHLLWPFLHVPSFLADYANPKRWGEPGFARFIVAVCTLSSRHVDDPRVRAVPGDPSSAGKSYLELFKKMQDLPSADRPTLYSMQANFLAAIYCMGLGTLSKAFQLFAEAITMCVDGGLHRDVGEYAIFDPIEREVRKRTFWSVYCWDKQSGACFGRPAMIHLRDCDVPEPVILDDEYITKDGLGVQPEQSKSRISAFVAAIRLHVVLEGVLDGCVRPSDFATSPFLSKAAQVIAKRHPQSEALREEEALLEDWQGLLEPHWAYGEETVGSKDPIRITQAERLHCLENLVKMLIYRHRFSGFVTSPAETPEERARHLELCRTAGGCALAIVADHLHISQRGFMTYYGVHVVHQLAQAGRTLLAVILNCKSPESRPLAASSIEGFRSCVGLLRRFSGRYLCGLRSADILEEFCRICHVPVDLPQVPDASKPSPAWLRPVRRRHSVSPTRREHASSASPASVSDIPQPPLSPPRAQQQQQQQQQQPLPPPVQAGPVDSTIFDEGAFLAAQASFGDLNREDPDDYVFASEFFDLNAAASPPSPLIGAAGSAALGDSALGGAGNGVGGASASTPIPTVNGFGSFGEPMDFAIGAEGFGAPAASSGVMMDDLGDLGLPSAGMDGLMPTVEGGENLSASEILALLHQGEFDYSSLFPDQQIFPP